LAPEDNTAQPLNNARGPFYETNNARIYFN
jgi:hypothetical protein